MILKNFKELNSKDVEIAGGKGASLGEMTQAGIPVPPGFVVLSSSFDKFITDTELDDKIADILSKVNTDDVESVNKASKSIQDLILNAEFPESYKSDISNAFKDLDTKYVAVRSSATSEDSADAAWAGQLDSFLNTTESTLLENIKRCWASLFTPRAIFYRFEKNLQNEKVSVAVVVQKMVNSIISGISFSVHPVTQDKNQLIIEGGLGLGEAIVSGSVTPDSYVFDKEEEMIQEINIGEQRKQLIRKDEGGNEWVELGEEGNTQKLTGKQIFELAKIIINIEKHYGFPVDVEWAIENNTFYIVQSRPITTLD
jgi:pyruvate,water dikinase